MAAGPGERCGCHSGRPYRDCCRPFHRAEALPPSCEALMRARYCAYARKELDFLWETLHPDHEDRKRPEAQVKRELREFAQRCRFTGLTVLETTEPGPDGIGRVRFWAKVFEGGKDRSFTEHSEFLRDSGAWKYLRGAGTPAGVPSKDGTASD